MCGHGAQVQARAGEVQAHRPKEQRWRVLRKEVGSWTVNRREGSVKLGFGKDGWKLVNIMIQLELILFPSPISRLVYMKNVSHFVISKPSFAFSVGVYVLSSIL